MKHVPNSVTRFVSRSLLKLNANSPTILVVAGVVGLGATSVMAARATLKLDPILEDHNKARWEVKGSKLAKRDEQKALLRIYTDTTKELGKLYGPSVFVGTLSAVSVLGGHRILLGRHLATMAAYSSLFQEFQSYRNRVVETLGPDRERDIYDGARLEWREDPNHKGEYKLESKFLEEKNLNNYLRPWFDERNVNWKRDPVSNYLFLKGIQGYSNNMLNARGHVFLNDVLDDLGMPRCSKGAVVGWFLDGTGDDFIDFGFMSSNEPGVIAFRDGFERSVQLNFNIDGLIWDKLDPR